MSPLRVGVVMDPIDKIHIDKDTTGEINIDTFNAGLTYSFW